MTNQKFIVCLMGPTASGKTDLAIQLLQQLPFDIISVDSAMVYRGMDIGTAKPDAQILQQAPHRLIDIREPQDTYSAANFRDDALAEIHDIFSQGRIPLLVGGTMLYFKVLQQGLSPLPRASAVIREQLLQQAAIQGWEALYQQLQTVDPLAAARIHPNDPQRLQRALEVYLLTGKPMSVLLQEAGEAFPYKIIYLSIMPADRDYLRSRIAQRFSEMLTLGLIDEVSKLKKNPQLSIDTPAMKAVGYRQVWEYLAGDLNLSQLKERGVYATAQLAKRQMTWLRTWPANTCFESTDPALMKKIVIHLNSVRLTF